jgi:hypothetical protein
VSLMVGWGCMGLLLVIKSKTPKHGIQGKLHRMAIVLSHQILFSLSDRIQGWDEEEPWIG